MSVREATRTKASSAADRSGRLFLLDLSGGRVLSMDPDGSNRKIIATGCPHPDGIVVDVAAGHVYWTNMGVPSSNDGSIERADLDGKQSQDHRSTGGTFTPKQLHLDKANGKLYWSDREGHARDARESRRLADRNPGRDRTKAKLTAATRRDGALESPSIPSAEQIYWTQKGADNAGVGRILRAGIDIPTGETRDQSQRHRGLLRRPSRADRSRARSRTSRPLLDRSRRSSARQHGESRVHRREARQNAPQIVVTDLMEGIGIALDVPGNRMFVTDLAGSLYSAKLDGTDKRTLLVAQGNLTGIAYAEI